MDIISKESTQCNIQYLHTYSSAHSSRTPHHDQECMSVTSLFKSAVIRDMEKASERRQGITYKTVQLAKHESTVLKPSNIAR
jgi:hypothetical protein